MLQMLAGQAMSAGLGKLMGGSQPTAPKQTETPMPQTGGQIIHAQNRHSVDQGATNV
jgi:hypothetical protein